MTQTGPAAHQKFAPAVCLERFSKGFATDEARIQGGIYDFGLVIYELMMSGRDGNYPLQIANRRSEQSETIHRRFSGFVPISEIRVYPLSNEEPPQPRWLRRHYHSLH